MAPPPGVTIRQGRDWPKLIAAVNELRLCMREEGDHDQAAIGPRRARLVRFRLLLRRQEREDDGDR